MRFFTPQWLWLIPVLIIAIPALFISLGKRGANSLGFLSTKMAQRLASPGTGARRRITSILLILGALLITLGLARPQYGVKPVHVKKSGIDVVIALDTSKSMAATDLKPNRMDRAKIEMVRLLKGLEGNRIGLVAFAGVSFLETPLTLDIGAVKMIADSLTVGSIPVPGTAISKAIHDAVETLTSSKAKSRAIVLFTDGESLSGDVEGSANAARDAGIIVFPIGIGSTRGAPVPTLNDWGEVTGFRRGENGKAIITKLDLKTLQSIADITGGTLLKSQGESLDLQPLIDNLKGMEKTDISSMEFTEYQERYQSIVFLALMLLFFEFIIIVRWPKANASSTSMGSD